MKKIGILVFGILAFQAQAQTIADARAMGEDSTVTISGIVSNGEELGAIRYMQDGTAGIAVYAPSVMENVQRGDSITVTGQLVDYNGLLETDTAYNLIVHGSGYTLSPQLVAPSQMGEDIEGELIQINSLVFDNGGSIFSQGMQGFTANGESGIVYVRDGSPLEGELIPIGEIGLIGIVSQYTFTGFGGYQLLPRDIDDFILSNGIMMSSGLTQTNITTDGFDVSWITNIDGSSNYLYGITPQLELGEINDGASTTAHQVSLSGLLPGTIYYVQTYSVNETDTAFSNTAVYATQSLSSGEIRAYFNHSVDNSVATVEDATNISVYMNDTIKAYIDLANTTLDIAVYNHSDAMITSAINDAYDRGVAVRYITCGSTTTTALGDLNSNIPVLERPEGTGLMHDKFIIIDAYHVDSCWISSGSTNWTSGQLFDDFNNIIFIQDQSVARAYELEFEEMWGATGLTPDASNAKFGSAKTDNTPHEFIVNGDRVEVYFSPSDQTTNHLVDAIETADYEIDFGLLAFTNNDLAWALQDQFNAGTEVNGIIEQINGTGAEYDYLLSLGIDVRSHQGVSGMFHHKYCIIDQDEPTSDPMVITGSHNWSAAAETNNDENTVIVHSANISNQYYQEFIERFNELTQAPLPTWNCVGDACIDPADGSGAYSSLALCEASCVSGIMDLEKKRGKLLYISDVLGRKTKMLANTLQFYIYENGEVVKRMTFQQ